MIVPQTKKQVLVVESDPGYCERLVNLLEGHGFAAFTAASTQGVIHKAAAMRIDLIICAEELLDGSGFAVCDTVKSYKNTRHIPVVILSLNCQKIRKHLHCADDYVTRDFNKEELLARIEAVWQRGRVAANNPNPDKQKQIVDELQRVISDGLIEPHFQPIYALHPFRMYGLEVLSRPTAGTLLNNPTDLFAAAMKYNMYYPLEMVCWRKALDVVSSYTRNEHIFFNCNPYMVENSKFPGVRDLFEQSRIPSENVVLEITERSLITEQSLYYDRLNEYREHGFRFAVDDVGAGYASLESIVTTKPEIVKIDAHIVRDLNQDPIKRSIVKFIVGFCKENEITVVAEGVETREEMDSVVELGVDAVQGYYLYRPTPDFNLRQMKDACVCFS